MKIIPAIDILDRLTARSLGNAYIPFHSVLSVSPDPVAVAKAYQLQFGFPEIYVADLDAIYKEMEPNFDLFTAIKEATGCTLRIDAAISDSGRAEKTFRSGGDRIIIGTETLRRTEFINEALQEFGAESVIISQDLEGKQLLSACPILNRTDPIIFAKELEVMGVKEIMVLDLPRAGTGMGVNVEVVEDIMNQIRKNLTLVDAIVQAVSMDVLAGSGLGSIDELRVLQEIGASAVTIARTLHEGEITPSMLRSLSRFGCCHKL